MLTNSSNFKAKVSGSLVLGPEQSPVFSEFTFFLVNFRNSAIASQSSVSALEFFSPDGGMFSLLLNSFLANEFL